MFRSDELQFPAETVRGVIAFSLVFGHAAIKVIRRADVISPPTTQNIDPSHRKAGSAGTRTRNQRLKRALLYRLSYRPAWE